MIGYLCSVLTVLVLSVSIAQAQTYIHDYAYKVSEVDDRRTSRVNALDQVKIILLQDVGKHVQQKSHGIKEGAGNAFSNDDVEAITASLSKVEILEEEWSGETYYLKAQMEAEADRIINTLKEFRKKRSRESRQLLVALKNNQRLLTIARDEVIKLRSRFEQASSHAEKEKIINKYNEQLNQISLFHMFSKGYDNYQRAQYEEAVYWYRQAAEQGYATAQAHLGYMYSKGQGVKQDSTKAYYWIQKAVAQECDCAK